jgi:hypothetical protein
MGVITVFSQSFEITFDSTGHDIYVNSTATDLVKGRGHFSE